MHEQPRRQLFSAPRGVLSGMICALLLAVYAGADEPRPTPTPLDQELQAAAITENAVMARITDEGKSAASQDDMEKMAGIYEGIVQRNPGSVTALNADAEYLWRIKRFEDAMTKWNAAEKLDPKNAVVADHLGGCYLALGNEKKSTQYFERAAKLDPKNAQYQFNAGNTCFLFRRQMADGADDANAVALRSLAHFRQASKIEPFNVDYARAYAETFYGIERPNWNEALIAWSHYLDITDKKDFAYSNLARVNIKLGRKKEAREALARIGSDQFNPVKEHLLREIGPD